MRGSENTMTVNVASISLSHVSGAEVLGNMGGTRTVTADLCGALNASPVAMDSGSARFLPHGLGQYSNAAIISIIRKIGARHRE